MSIPLDHPDVRDASSFENGLHSTVALSVIFALGVVAAGLVIWAASPYPGVTVDSAEYLAVAEGLLAGEGFTMPYLNYDEPYRVLSPGERVSMTQFPPLYPLLLAAAQAALPGGPLDAARGLGALLMGALVVAGGVVVARETGRAWLGVAAAALLMAPDVLTLNAMAWSEGPAVLCLIGALYFTACYLRTGRWQHVAPAFLLGAVASLARYAGIAFVTATAVSILLYAPRPFLRRIVIAVGGGIAALIPVALWLVRNVSVAGEASEKEVAWHPPGLKQIIQTVEAIGAWTVPGPVLPLIGGIVTIGFAGVMTARWLRRSSPSLSPITRTCVIFFGVYGLFVISTRTLLDQNISMDLRILAPLHVIVVIGVCCSLRTRSLEDVRQPVAAALIVLSLLTVARGFFVAARFASISVAGYTGTRWRASETLEAAGQLEAGVPIVTNAPDPLWLWQNRMPFLVPPRSNRYSGAPNYEYLDQVEQLRARLGCEGVVVWFDQPTRKPPRIIDPVLAAGLDVVRTRDLGDGELYEAADC